MISHSDAVATFERVKEIAGKATPGPWELQPYGEIFGGDHWIGTMWNLAYRHSSPDSRLIVLAPLLGPVADTMLGLLNEHQPRGVGTCFTCGRYVNPCTVQAAAFALAEQFRAVLGGAE